VFPKPYARVLGKIVEEIVRNQGRERADELLRRLARQAAGRCARGNEHQTEIEAAADLIPRPMGPDTYSSANELRMDGAGKGTLPTVCRHVRASRGLGVARP